MRPVHFAPILFCLCLSWRSALTQEVPAPPATPVTEPWTWVKQLDLNVGEKIYVVTASHPRRKQPCNVDSVEAGHIACSRHFGRKPRLLTQADVIALIRPGYSDNPKLGVAVCAITAGALIAGAVFLGPAIFPLGLFLAVPTGLAGVTVGLFCPLVLADGTKSSRTPDVLLYQAPNLNLQVALH